MPLQAAAFAVQIRALQLGVVADASQYCELEQVVYSEPLIPSLAQYRTLPESQ